MRHGAVMRWLVVFLAVATVAGRADLRGRAPLVVRDMPAYLPINPPKYHRPTGYQRCMTAARRSGFHTADAWEQAHHRCQHGSAKAAPAPARPSAARQTP